MIKNVQSNIKPFHQIAVCVMCFIYQSIVSIGMGGEYDKKDVKDRIVHPPNLYIYSVKTKDNIMNNELFCQWGPMLFWIVFYCMDKKH